MIKGGGGIMWGVGGYNGVGELRGGYNVGLGGRGKGVSCGGGNNVVMWGMLKKIIGGYNMFKKHWGRGGGLMWGLRGGRLSSDNHLTDMSKAIYRLFFEAGHKTDLLESEISGPISTNVMRPRQRSDLQSMDM
ncbi:hypothetical protein DPMN_052999 [Dreissena polymorpha]|uniref:Uncharacterized protein n=1 Tax=Dreissena polymorpha TaxID=45954 RepID=A0A9D4CMG2_DREPO|nr:hypothetical protein DPMN_052999 [Dreissena polymorpha]